MFSAGQSLSKDNQLPGYIVLAHGDTVHGSITYKKWDRNPRRIVFKTQTNVEQSYEPEDIVSFYVNGESYVSAIVEIDISSMGLASLDSSPDPIITTDTVFLKSVFSGYKSLFYLKDKSGRKQLYVASENERPYLLIYKKYYQEIQSPSGATRTVVENENFKNQLISLLRECPDLFKVIENSSYEIRPLAKIFSEYHKCAGRTVKYQNEHKEIQVETGVMAGVTLTQLAFEGDESFNYLTDVNYDHSITPSIGFFADWNLLRGRPVTISTEAFVTSFKFNGQHTGITNENWYDITNSSFNYTYLKANGLIKYRLFGNNAKVSIIAGGSFGYAIVADESIQVTHKFYSSVSEREIEFESRKTAVGWIVGLGVKFNRFGLEGRYENNEGISDVSSLGSSVSQFHFLLSYSLRRHF